MKTISPVSSLRKALLALLVAVFATGAVAGPAFATKYASIVIDMDTAQVLHARNADEARYPASLTKVMTLYLVFDAIKAGKLKLTDKMKVSKFASQQQPSKLGLKKGSTIKVEDAIRALVTKSANDVAVVFAEKLGGTEAKFAVKMNAKAKQLGMTDTTFKNASGLPNKAQVSTARDLAKLAEAIYMDHRGYYDYFSTPDFVWKKRHFANHNNLLRKVDGVDGIKTGFTNASGYNLMASAQRDGHRVIAVMLGGSTARSRDQHVGDLLEAAFTQIKGGITAIASDLRSRIEFADMSTAERLAAEQLKAMGDDSNEEPEFANENPGVTDDDDEDAGSALLASSNGVQPGMFNAMAPAPGVSATYLAAAGIDPNAPRPTTMLNAPVTDSLVPTTPAPLPATVGLPTSSVPALAQPAPELRLPPPLAAEVAPVGAAQ